jgi:single-stranded DNA-binding protein
MNLVVLVGTVTDRPFRPGGERVVVKLAIPADKPGVTDNFEVHLFGTVGSYALDQVRSGDVVSLRGRLETRIWTEGDEEFEELRIVGQRIERIGGGSSGSNRGPRPPRPRFDRQDDQSAESRRFPDPTISQPE